MKGNSHPKKTATPEDIVKLARKVKWTDITSTQGEIVEAGTIKEIFRYAATGLKRKKTRKRAHATVA